MDIDIDMWVHVDVNVNRGSHRYRLIDAEPWAKLSRFGVWQNSDSPFRLSVLARLEPEKGTAEVHSLDVLAVSS